MGPEPRGRADQGQPGANPSGEEPRARPEPKVKSFEIDKRLIVEAYGLKELYPLLQRINYYLVRWLRKKYRRLRTWKKLLPCWERITSQYPAMFVHWRQVKWYWRTG